MTEFVIRLLFLRRARAASAHRGMEGIEPVLQALERNIDAAETQLRLGHVARILPGLLRRYVSSAAKPSPNPRPLRIRPK
jgi:hypothetical protein